MKTTRLMLLAAMVSMTALPALAQEFWDTGNLRYNWLLNRDAVSSTNGGTAHGSVGGPQASLSTGQRVWIPHSDVTGNGANTYYAQLDFGQPRDIEYLRVRTYCEGGMGFDYLVVQFSNDANFSTYQEQALYDGDWYSASTGNWSYDQLLGTTYNARYVRVVFLAGHYTSSGGGSGNFGGPGLWCIEPLSPVGAKVEVNSSIDLAFNAFTPNPPTFTWVPGIGETFGSGSDLCDGNMDNFYARGGGSSSAWAAGGYFTVELNDVYRVDAVRINWNDDAWFSKGLTLEFSEDGKTWDLIESVVVTDPAVLGDPRTPAYITFDPRAAKFVRWRNVAEDPDNPGSFIAQPGYTIANEFMVYGQLPVPEPVTLTLLTLGGLAMLRRRR